MHVLEVSPQAVCGANSLYCCSATNQKQNIGIMFRLEYGGNNLRLVVRAVNNPQVSQTVAHILASYLLESGSK